MTSHSTLALQGILMVSFEPKYFQHHPTVIQNPQAPEPLPPTFTSYTLPELDPSYLPPEVNQFCQSFPFTPPAIPIGSIQSSIESFLPPVGRAIALCETFLEHLSWMFQIVTRQQLINELIPVIYKQKKASYGPHDLALMLCVLGIGALVDLTLEPYNLEAQHYYRLARAAATLQPVLAEQSVVTIKVLSPAFYILILRMRAS